MEITLHHVNDTVSIIQPYDIASDLKVYHLLARDIPKYKLMEAQDSVFKIVVDVKSKIWNDPDVRDDVFKFAATVLLPTGILEAPTDTPDLFLKKEKGATKHTCIYSLPRKFDIPQDGFKKLWVLPEYKENSVVRPHLYPHQVKGFSFWKNRDYRALWAHDMGLGKTFTAGFLLYKNLFAQKWKRPVVLTLDSILLKWESILISYGIPYVIMKSGMDITAIPEGAVLLGNIEKLKRKNGPKDDGTEESKKAVKRFAAKPFLERMRVVFPIDFFDLVIFDESHKLNNASNLVVEILSRIITKRTAVLFMSGTPFGNGFHEVYSQMNLIQPGLFGETSQGRFYIRYCKNTSKNTSYERWEVDEYYFPLLKKKLYTKADFVKNAPGLELPPFTESNVPYRMTSEQNKVIRSIHKDYTFPLPENPPEWLTAVCPEGIPLSSSSLIRHLIRMACSGIIKAKVFIPGMPEEYFDKGYQVTLKVPTRKYTTLTDILDGMCKDQQSLIWINYVATGKQLVKDLKARGYSAELVYGGTSKKKRKEIVDKFLKGEIQHLCSHPKCLGTGLDFVNATTQVAYECPESAIDYDQAKKRSHRIGQTKAVQMLRLYGQSSIEKRIVDMLEGKLSFSSYIFGLESKKKIPEENMTFRWEFGSVNADDIHDESCPTNADLQNQQNI